MDGTICLPQSAEPLEIHGLSESARSREAVEVDESPRALKPARETSAAYEAWLHQPARTKIRRPLSPICPLIIGERPPTPPLWRRAEVQRILPLAGSIALHIAVLLVGL